MLGPLLYILYTNDIPNVTGEKTILYADDTTLLFSDDLINPLTERVTSAVDTLVNYFNNNGLTLNISKTQCLLFGNRKFSDFELMYNNIKINSVKSIRFLGVGIDERLDWRGHIETVAVKIAQFSFALRIISDAVGVDAALSAYYAFIYSRIKYGIIFWGNSSDIGRILLLQKKCIRSIFRMKPTESCKNYFIEQKILTITSIYVVECIMFVYDNWQFFKNLKLTHNYPTRNKSYLVGDKYNFSYLQKNVDFSLIKMYNFLPECVRGLARNKLKATLKIFLAKKAFYSLEEFYRSDKAVFISLISNV